jgi:hypothetical protein
MFYLRNCEAFHLRLLRLALVTLAQARTVEASMDGSFNRPYETGIGIYRRRGIGFLAFPAVLAIALIGLTITPPAASHWISEAAKAVLAGANLLPDAAPTRVAEPAGKVRRVKACRLIQT